MREELEEDVVDVVIGEEVGLVDVELDDVLGHC